MSLQLEKENEQHNVTAYINTISNFLQEDIPL